MTIADVTTVRLPHSGLHVPDRSYQLTAYKELPTSCGVAFNANLRVNKKLVGTIENTGQGGMTMFHPRDWHGFGQSDLEAYAVLCHTEEEQPVDVEALLDALIDEHDWTRKVAAAARRNRMTLRLREVQDDGFPPFVLDIAESGVPRHERDWTALAQQIAKEMPPPELGWWQGWTGQGWRDATQRPEVVADGLYG